MKSLIVSLFLLCAAPAFADADYSVLTNKKMLDGDVLTVGDLFTNAGASTDYVLAPSPAPGNVTVLSKRDLQRVADTFHLRWLPPSDFVALSLQRAAAQDDDLVAVPVLNRPLATGTAIGNADVTELNVPRAKLRGATILDKSALIGMMPRRNLSANAVLQNDDVMPPVLVKRNELITVTYRNGAIALTTKARALANGSKGDTVTLLNVSSKKPFDAVISGPSAAEIVADNV